jgi:hypothetical protein
MESSKYNSVMKTFIYSIKGYIEIKKSEFVESLMKYIDDKFNGNPDFFVHIGVGYGLNFLGELAYEINWLPGAKMTPKLMTKTLFKTSDLGCKNIIMSWVNGAIEKHPMFVVTETDRKEECKIDRLYQHIITVHVNEEYFWNIVSEVEKEHAAIDNQQE